MGNLSNSQVIMGASIIGLFLGSAFLTYKVGSEEDQDDLDYTTETTTEKNNTEADELNKELDALLSQSDKEDLTKDIHVVKQEVTNTDPYEDLDKMVGLESVKAEVKSLANYVKLMKEREAQGLKSPRVTYHCVFSGNPGTGKTTIARILARIYKDLGVVTKGHLVETDRSGLVGQYVGQTAPKTNAIVDQAIGGVLFIDEAYSLTQDDDSYGEEAIATLLKRMEDDRDNLVVIVAGYTNEMKKFIETNPGLQSRFTRYIDFPDYTPDELYKIFEARMQPYSISLSPEAQTALRSALETAVKKKTRNFGNGRYVRNLFESAVTNMANRLSDGKNHTVEELNTLSASDINLALKQVKM